MHHIARFLDPCQHRGSLRAVEVFQRRGGDEGFQGLPIAVLEALADGGGADGLSPACLRGTMMQWMPALGSCSFMI